VFLGRRSFPIDRIAYFGIFLEGWYDADYRGAVVVDVGAHKGYYGAFALLEGAQEVRSYEPESANFAALERAAATFDKPWSVNRAAIGAKAGAAQLRVSAESASHSLVHEESNGPRRTVRSETVAMLAMRDVLADAAAAGRPLVVKVDAEGAECDIVLETPVEVWQLVDHVFLEVHHFARCSTKEIVAHLQAAGLEVVLYEPDEDADLVALRR
jgi:FkbM family methyltransferase